MKITSQTIVSGISILKFIIPNIKNHKLPKIKVNFTKIIFCYNKANEKKK